MDRIASLTGHTSRVLYLVCGMGGVVWCGLVWCGGMEGTDCSGNYVVNIGGWESNVFCHHTTTPQTYHTTHLMT